MERVTYMVSLGAIYCKVSMLICLRSSNSSIRLDLESKEEELFQKSGKKQEELLAVFKWKLLAL